MLNPNKKIEKGTDPFPHLIIRNFFKEEFYNELENFFPKKEEFKKQDNIVNRMHYDTTFGDDLYQNILNKSKAYKELHDYIYGKEFVKTFLDFFDQDINYELENNFLNTNVKNLDVDNRPYEVGKVLNQDNLKKGDKSFLFPRLDIGLGEEGYGVKTGGKGIHVDNPQRLISILFYVGGFSKISGGEHRLWKKIDDDIEVAKEINPDSNLLIASLQNNISFHDVNPIKEISGTRNAFYIAISCNNPIWKKVKVNDFNLKHNRNRCKSNIFTKIKNKLFKN